jgi:hypothetical protein
MRIDANSDVGIQSCIAAALEGAPGNHGADLRPLGSQEDIAPTTNRIGWRRAIEDAVQLHCFELAGRPVGKSPRQEA